VALGPASMTRPAHLLEQAGRSLSSNPSACDDQRECGDMARVGPCPNKEQPYPSDDYADHSADRNPWRATSTGTSIVRTAPPRSPAWHARRG